MSITTAFLILFAYLLGSISSAVIFCRLSGLPDPRENGSNNPGATNVLRLGGRLAALGVLLADVLKGMLPVALSLYWGLAPSVVGGLALAACVGHIFPIFFHFRGGKGVATALGALIPLGHEIAGIALLVWLVSFVLFGYASLSAVIVALIMPAVVWWFMPALTFPVALLACLLLYRHHDNLQRLWRGEEAKLWRHSLMKREGELFKKAAKSHRL